MSDFDICIITCLNTAQRLPALVDKLQRLLSLAKPVTCRLILSYDIPNFDRTVFTESLWDRHIESIVHILAKNIQDISFVNSGTSPSLVSLLSSCSTTFFKARHLKQAEMSLLWKHYDSLCNVKRPTLVIEDDAHLRPGAEEYLLEVLHFLERNDMYIDLGSLNGLTKRGSPFRLGNHLSAYKHKIGMTRTTTAFALSSRVARILASSYWPCGLPADLHHQYLLQKYMIPGAWPALTLFDAMSTKGIFESSIQ